MNGALVRAVTELTAIVRELVRIVTGEYPPDGESLTDTVERLRRVRP